MRTHPTHPSRCLRLSSAALVWLALLPASARPAPARTGAQIYQRQCASCHGAHGEGTPEDYARPLAGDKSVAQLTRYIARRMPKDKPGSCTGEEARKVAVYIHDAFYSRAAQARHKPPRIELSRLTVRQDRNTVADLIGTFRTTGTWDKQRGLRGEYYNSRRMGGRGEVINRVDPVVRFDFGNAGPDPKKFDPYQFSIRWTGSVLAPETGEYEFSVRTEHAVRLWVNDPKRPLIDAWVKSGSDTEHRGTLSLLAGRAYFLRLEFSKAKQGVDDSKNNKKKPPVKASIALLWKLPHRTAEVIPSHNLTPRRFPETFVVQTPFPPDDRSTGYERGTSISKAWDQATTEAALETAGYVVAHLRELSGVPDNAPDRAARLRDFCRRFAERAFRRPLTEDQKRLYVERQFSAVRDPEMAVKRVVLLVLKSPRFLYPGVGGREDGYDVAARLALGLWDSLPDRELLDAAAGGRLATPAQVAHQAERMTADLRARAKLRAFMLQWLKVEQVPDLAKDRGRFPGFDPAVASDLRTSLELFLDDVLWSDASDFRQLLLADSLYLNGRLSGLYGGGLPPDAPFRKVTPKPGERAGILSHPYLLATFAYTADSSPIHRGVFLARSVLGRSLLPPPEAFTPIPAELHPRLTTRERVQMQTKSSSCLACHGMINPLGFTLENFDAVGRFRDKEKGRAIDATGEYQTRTGDVVKFNGLRDLASFLARSDEVHEAFVEQLFHYLVKQPLGAHGPTKLADLRRAFVANGYSVRKLMIQSMVESALAPRTPKPTTRSKEK